MPKPEPRPVESPREGFFLIRLVHKGPKVPAAICRDTRGWWCLVLGEPQSEPNTDFRFAEKVLSTWQYGQEITKDEYLRLVREFARPGAPNPRKPRDLNEIPPLF